MAGSQYDVPSGGVPGRPVFSPNPPPRITRSWTADGVQYTLNTTSWRAPGFSFTATSGSAGAPVSTTFAAPPRTTARQPAPWGRGRSLLGTAFGVLDDLARHTMQPQHTVIGGDAFGQGARARILNMSTDSDDEDDRLAYGPGGGAAQRKKNRRRSLFGRLKDRIVDGSQARRQSGSTSRSQSPAPHPEAPRRRQSSHRTERREPNCVPRPAPEPVRRDSPEYIEVDYHNGPEPVPVAEPDQRRSRHRRQSVTQAELEALENAVEMEGRNARACQMALAHASRQSNVSAAYLQRILDELKQHETALAGAVDALADAKAARPRDSRPPPRSRSAPRARVPPQARPSSQAAAPRTFEEEFLDPLGAFSPLFMHGRVHPADWMFRAMEDLHDAHFGRTNPFHAFEHTFPPTRPAPEDAHFRSFAPPGESQANAPRERRRQSMPTSGFTRAPNAAPPAHPTFPPAPAMPPQPPATMLRPDEAQRLFQAYNDRWNQLPATSSDIPYPARGLHAGGLAARDSIFAPTVAEHVSHWSDETVMQANAQAFFLGVVGLVAQYTQAPGTGRIACGFDPATARPAQIHHLRDILKREKTRWHSDRLGRRNDGRAGVNRALQRDETARAVFHAVCGLVESM